MILRINMLIIFMDFFRLFTDEHGIVFYQKQYYWKINNLRNANLFYKVHSLEINNLKNANLL